MAKFTDAKIRNLKPKAYRYEVWEGDTGLGVRVSPAGTKTWLYMYRYEGRARRITLGRYPALSVAEAHKAHAEARLKLQTGLDPGKERVQTNIAERRAGTVQELADDFIEGDLASIRRSVRHMDQATCKKIIGRLSNIQTELN